MTEMLTQAEVDALVRGITGDPSLEDVIDALKHTITESQHQIERLTGKIDCACSTVLALERVLDFQKKNL